MKTREELLKAVDLLFAAGAPEGADLQRQTEILEIIVKALKQYNEKSED